MFGIFSKKEPVEEAAPADDLSEHDAQTATFIQQKAQVGALFAGRLTDLNEDHAEQLQRYQKVRDDLLARLDTIEDEYSRGFASHMIINMCLVADDVAVARALIAGVRDEFIRDKIFESAPVLKPTF